MSKVIGVAFSDLHLANWKQFNDKGQRLEIANSAVTQILRASIKYDCPMLFTGDLNDHPKHMDNIVMNLLSQLCVSLRFADKTIIGINGNHDFHTKSTQANRALGYMHHLDRMGAPFTCIDYSYYDCSLYRVHGIPYINGNVDFKEALNITITNRSKSKGNILLIHTDLPGALEPDGREVGTAENIDTTVKKLFSKFDIVLCGHIHKHQKLGKNTFMIGAPMEQRRSDSGTKAGYILIYDDYTIKHISLNLPGFKYFNAGEEHPEDENFWIELPKPMGEIEVTDALKFDVKADRGKLAKNFLKAKGIKNKTKLDLLTSYLND